MWPIWRSLLAGHTRALLAVLLLGLLAAAIALVPPYLTKRVIDDGLMAADRGALIRWSLILLAVGAGALALGVLNSLMHMRASVAMLADLRARLISSVLRAPVAWRAAHSTGELLSRIDGDAGEVQRFAFNALLTSSGALLRLAGAGVMLFWLYWPLALIALALAPLELAFLAWARPRTESLSRSVREARGDFAARLAEFLHGLGQIRQIGAGASMVTRLQDGQHRLIDEQLIAHRFGELTRGVPTLIAAIARSIVFLVGGLAVIDGQIPLGTLIAFLGYLGFLIGPMQSLLGLWHGQARARVSFERIAALLEHAARPSEYAARPSQHAPDPGLPPAAGWPAPRILHQVGEPAGGAPAPTVPWVEAGEKVRLDGASGSGKTSMLRMLQGLDHTDRQRFLLLDSEGRPLPAPLRVATVVHVPQRPFVLRASVAENLRMLAPAADDALLRDALRVVELDDRFAGADGLATLLGEDGLSLSGGERQRLCIARALLRDGGLWLFDEAFSEVDRASAMRIWQRLDLRLAGRTRIVVSHDPQACGEVDRVIRLPDAPDV
ncbi:MAG: ABC transporter ATP-binding protein [Burkholderiaceae bacterium]